ncbi:ROK family protein [Saccharopolyspora indica]|uniref:ROK family transcriptional regulator n=1 Tax=Saccharopolyspora indica TaxID=1229659 RepID=UPI0022EB0ED2|nr:ROK family transcriptional regulator [Saccharopolyspora indica]MDA3644448.1 ROK family transcriptional regulator [Saccharopolyspora indica]
MGTPVETVASALPDSARAVLAELATSGAATRPQLGTKLNLSKPTVSAAITQLEAHDLVTAGGHRQGATGRTAVVYNLGPGAGHVLGLDVGSTFVRVRAKTLDGRLLAERGEEVPAGENANALAGTMLSSVRSELGAAHGPLRSIAAATSTMVGPVAPEGSRGPAVLEDLRRQLDPPESVPVLVENNVNCAAIAEMTHGAADGVDSFVYLQAGVRIGVGIVHNGSVVRGRTGGAGEIAYLPFPWGSGASPQRGELESYLGSAALMQRCRESWPRGHGTPPAQPAELFALAAQGDSAAEAAVRRHAEDLGNLVTATVAVLDPELVVLGGGIGQNHILLPGVQDAVRRLIWETPITTSQLGNEATVLGAVALAADAGLAELTRTPGTLSKNVRALTR